MDVLPTGRRRYFNRLLLSLSLLSLLHCGAAAPDAERQNVLLITLDTVRADHLSSYGYERATTPNLDRLAAEGYLFERAIAQAALTPVSHASILTGLNPPNHGVRVLYAGGGYRLSDQLPTLTTQLQSSGYRTGAFLSAFPVSEFFGFDHGFERFESGLDQAAAEVLEETGDGGYRFDTAANQRRSDETIAQALGWIGEADARPFFSWLHLWDPHDPKILPPDETMREWVDPQQTLRSARLREIYDAEIHYIDAQIGLLLDQLKSSGQLDNTIVVVVADHGEGLGEHQHWFHRILYQEQLHVPLIFSLPNDSGGRRVASQVRTIDIAPTLLELLEIESVSRHDGQSLLPLMRGAAESSPRLAYAEALIEYDLNATHLMKARPDDALLHSISDGEWKLIFKPRAVEKSELYNLLNDADESDNLYSVETEQARRLYAALFELTPFVTDGFGSGGDDEVIERLRSLGYVSE